jgi:DNA-dependent RNA polymerase auxiliary subunit epsilon
MKRFWIICLMGGVSWLLSHGAVYGQPTLGFTQEDRERIIRLETTLTLFMEATDQRFEQVDQRFIELREDMNIRFIELREDMNKRFEQADKRFAQVDQRFEDMNNRFEQMMNTLQLIAGIFTVLTLGVIGFAYWDRRTIIRKAKEETLETLAGEAAPKEQATIDRAVAQAVQEIKKDQRLPDLLSALRKLAATDPPLANVLKEFHLL